jgi:hypothetical protein
MKKEKVTPQDMDIRAEKEGRSKSAAPSENSADDGWERLLKIGEELGKGWQSEKSAVEILSEMRR